ncbi:FAD-dependent oxidoreductase [Actinocatenispora thailandica]|uniref:FAD-dependent oxidoreductase n=1 Tax=Actinocatenispora thailandica TaxID=227318 RepID=A0A7R7DRF0_9ACTN|nr:FAD-dependent monooxygenase [Actinocatenispora thailandica]BCJ36505.1 FAD-dependent oxidoreductase [Actinocatenispora thailandica]
MTQVLISGASIAGPALAYWLRRYGMDVTVVERAPALRPGGQGIDVRGAARTVIERMGLIDQVRAAHTGTRGIANVDEHNRRTAEMSAEAFGDSGGIVADLEILRADLSRILVEAADGVEYLFDDTITALDQHAGGVDVTFERAGARRFDLVVGADGIFSATRRIAFGADDWRMADSGYHRAVFTARTSLRLDGWELMYSMPAGNGTTGGRNVLLYPAHDEARAMFHFACDPIDYDRRDIAAQKAIVARVFAGERWQVPELLASMADAPDFYFDRVGKIEMTRWYRDRVILLGDSCFAGSVGMGTSMAIVGAYVLAGELAAAGGDHRTGYPAYQARMAGYVAANRKPLPGGVKGFLPATRRGIRLRDWSMRMMTKLPGGGMMMGGIDKAVNAIDLPDYPVPAAR